MARVHYLGVERQRRGLPPARARRAVEPFPFDLTSAPALTPDAVAELRAEVAQLRQALASQGRELAELKVQLNVGPSWMSTDEMRAMVAEAEAEDDARLKEGA